MVCSFFRVIRAYIPFFNRRGVLCRGVMAGALLLYASFAVAGPVSVPNRIQMRSVNSLIEPSRIVIQPTPHVVRRDFRSSSAVPAASYDGGVFTTMTSSMESSSTKSGAYYNMYEINTSVSTVKPTAGSSANGVAIPTALQYGSAASTVSPTAVIVRPRGGQYHAIGTTADLTLAKFEHSTNSPLLRAPGAIGGGTNNGFDMWLQGIEGEAFIYEYDGVRYYDQALLRAAFEEAIKSGNMPGLTWEEFLAWFNTQGETPQYAFPIGDIWSLLVLVVVYTLWVVSKRKRVVVKNVEIK